IVAYIETEAGAAAAVSPSPEPSLPEAAVGQPEVPAASPAPAAAGQPAGGPAREASAPVDEDTLEGRLRSRSSPLVRRIAAEHGVELRDIQGSGRMGRVTKDDILSFVEEAQRAPAAAPASAPTD